MASLYRKWRSRTFDDVVGQEPVVRTLRNAVSKHRIAHAYLFTGPRGTGKTSTARILAKAVNCLQPHGGNPCDACEMCRAANEGRALDVIEIDAASNTSVDSVRDLRERVAYAAGEGRYKVYIVDEVHRLSGAAFDAFLKTLEEPPPHVIFIFASTEPHKVPETITSRCQRFDFRRIGPVDTLGRLRQVAEGESLQVSLDALRMVALHSGGSLRDALGLLDQVASYTDGEITDDDVRIALGLADASLVTTLTDCLVSGETGRGLTEFNRFVDSGGDPRQLMRQFVEYLRALLLQVSGVQLDELAVDPALLGQLRSQAGTLRETQVLALLRAMSDGHYSSKYNLPLQLPFELAYVQAALSVRGDGSHRAPQSAETAEETRAREVPPIGRSTRVEGPRPAEAAEPERAPPVEPRREDEFTADPAPASSQGAAAEPGDVESLWPTIVSTMRSRSPLLQAVIRSGTLLKTGDGELTVGFLHAFHRDQFADVKKRRVLEEVVGEVLGGTYRVTCVLTTKEEIEAIRGADAVQNDDGFVEEVVERLRAYHAKEFHNGHS